jgi:hypothetical protein
MPGKLIHEKLVEDTVAVPCDVIKSLPFSLRFFSDAAAWLLAEIVHRTMQRDLNASGLVELHSDDLRQVMGKEWQAIIHALIDAEVIEVHSRNYADALRGYRLHGKYVLSRRQQWRIENQPLLERIARHQIKHNNTEETNDE